MLSMIVILSESTFTMFFDISVAPSIYLTVIVEFAGTVQVCEAVLTTGSSSLPSEEATVKSNSIEK